LFLVYLILISKFDLVLVDVFDSAISFIAMLVDDIDSQLTTFLFLVSGIWTEDSMDWARLYP